MILNVRILLVVGLLLLRVCGELQAQQLPQPLAAIPDPKSLGQTFVSDPGGVLSPRTVQALNRCLHQLDSAGRAHIDVAIARSVGELEPKDAVHQLFHSWRIGRSQANDGLLILLVLDQRRIEFETGYGLEADLPDAICYRIQQRYMVPYLRAGQYDSAVVYGVQATIQQLTGSSAWTKSLLASSSQAAATSPADSTSADDSYVSDESGSITVTLYEPPPAAYTWLIAYLPLVQFIICYHFIRSKAWFSEKHRRAAVLLFAVLVGVCSFFFVMMGPPLKTIEGISNWNVLQIFYGVNLLVAVLYFYVRIGRWAWRKLSGTRQQQYLRLYRVHRRLEWLAWVFPVPMGVYWLSYLVRLDRLRYLPYACPGCGQAMQRLSGAKESKNLQPGQQREEQVASVDYDVWQCAQCANTLTLRYANPDSFYTRCPSCHFYTTEHLRTKREEQPTYEKSGWGWAVYRCCNCAHEYQEKITLPRLDPEAETSSYSSSSSGSYSSGGGSSSGGFSSSSGGDSGGGGAGSSW